MKIAECKMQIFQIPRPLFIHRFDIRICNGIQLNLQAAKFFKIFFLLYALRSMLYASLLYEFSGSEESR